MTTNQLIRDSIISDMSEGVMAIRFDGKIELVNDAALKIFGRREEELLGRTFAVCFFDEAQNDAFTQSVLDAIYDKASRQESYVPYYNAEGVRQLRIVSSYLKENGAPVGVILTISDITELTEMRDAVRAMEQIRGLNHQLEIRNTLLKETFGRYLSDDIVREILDSPDGARLGGQRRRLTILMSDLRGFTAMCARMEPESLITMLNHYFIEMYEEISRYHGTLIEFLGDGMFVIFGAPISSDHHASDAVAAALAMQKRMTRVNQWNAEHGFEPLSMGIGINTDEVIVGNIGSERRTKYGVMGPGVNLAGRIESYTTEGQILISPSTRASIPEELNVIREFSASPKGVSGVITLTVVAGIGAPYDIVLNHEELDEMRTLSAPAPVRFRVVDGKHMGGELYDGEILRISEKQALLRAEHTELSVFENLCLETGGKLYAKVTSVQADCAVLSFTSKPKTFKAWVREL